MNPPSRSYNAPKQCAKNGFTLLELLVVIAIVTLLAALLIPTASKMMRKSLQASTMSHLRQIYLGIINYSNDHDGSLPGPTTQAIYNYGRQMPIDSDLAHLGAYISPYLDSLDASTNSAQGAYLFPVKTLKCPALTTAAQENTQVANFVKLDYGQNSGDNIFGAALGGSGGTFADARLQAIQPKRMGALTDKQRRTAIITTADLEVWNNPTFASMLSSNGVFDGKRLWLFMDGSQELSTNTTVWTH